MVPKTEGSGVGNSIIYIRRYTTQHYNIFRRGATFIRAAQALHSRGSPEGLHPRHGEAHGRPSDLAFQLKTLVCSHGPMPRLEQGQRGTDGYHGESTSSSSTMPPYPVFPFLRGPATSSPRRKSGQERSDRTTQRLSGLENSIMVHTKGGAASAPSLLPC